MIYLNDRPARRDLRVDASETAASVAWIVMGPFLFAGCVLRLVVTVALSLVQLIPSPVRLLVVARHNHDLTPERWEFGVYVYRLWGRERWCAGVGTVAWRRSIVHRRWGPFAVLRWTVPPPRTTPAAPAEWGPEEAS